MRKIYIVGIGMGNRDTLTLGAQKAIDASDGLIGAKRMVDSFLDFSGERSYEITADSIFRWICDKQNLQTISVVMSGDVGFFSGSTKLITALQEANAQAVMDCGEDFFDVEVVAGISSLQYFCAKIKKPWQDMGIISMHGRESDIVGEVQTHENTFVLTGSDHPAQDVCNRLCRAGWGEVQVWVGERLSYPTEKISVGKAKELQGESFDALSVMVIENKQICERTQVSYGLEDACFVRGSVPMTKAEVRSVTLSKLQIKETDCIYDIGAGTGSVSVELALMANRGRVFAIETNEEGVQLIGENKKKFGVPNLQIVEGLAPEALTHLPTPDKAFIGGTKGTMERVLLMLMEKNPHIRVVINAITIESVAEAMDLLQKHGFDQVEMVQLSVARAKVAGQYHLMMGQNPVFIISGEHSV